MRCVLCGRRMSCNGTRVKRDGIMRRYVCWCGVKLVGVERIIAVQLKGVEIRNIAAEAGKG